MTMTAHIEEKLQAALSPILLEVVDESYQHEGHEGARPGGGTHMAIFVVSSVFEGLSRVERQRRVYAAIAEELGTRVHAITQMKTLTPAEYEAHPHPPASNQ